MPDEQTDDTKEPRLRRRSGAAYVGAAFALMFAVLLASDLGFVVGFAAAIGAGLALGQRFPGKVAFVGGGVLPAVLLYAVIGAQIAAGPGSEWSSTEELVDAIATVAILVTTLVAYLLAARRRPARLAAWRDDAIFAASGALVGVGAGVTLLALLVVPASRSYELPAATGWAEASDAAMPQQARLFFAGRAAIYVSGDPGVDRSGPAAMMGVLNASGTSYNCVSVFDPRPGTPLLIGTGIENGDVTLAPGPATRIHLTLNPTGEDAYLYFLRRSRMIGLAHEDLCYLLAVVGKPGVPLDPKIPDGLADAFRFR
jgi:hypothetical protein